jgi:hypothetical protein
MNPVKNASVNAENIPVYVAMMLAFLWNCNFQYAVPRTGLPGSSGATPASADPCDTEAAASAAARAAIFAASMAATRSLHFFVLGARNYIDVRKPGRIIYFLFSQYFADTE